MKGFRLSRQARTDLLDIATFTASRWDAEQAERYVTRLFHCFQKLVDEPGLRRTYAEIPGYWRALEARHAVFYRVADDGELLIIRVLHAAMLPELHLSTETDEEAEQ